MLKQMWVVVIKIHLPLQLDLTGDKRTALDKKINLLL